MPRAVAINVAANTNQPGVRGPIFPNGRFEYLPIPESEPTARPVPTYADLDVSVELPDGTEDSPVHLDPEFADYPCCERYTYGDPFDVKARPLLELERDDYVLFYATLSTVGEPNRQWISPEWGTYVIGQFRLARDPISGAAFADLSAETRTIFENNAHLKREEFDAKVLLEGEDGESELYDTAVPLSSPDAGSEANRIVTELSSDSGKGPWWRRPMKFEADGVAEILQMREDGRFR